MIKCFLTCVVVLSACASAQKPHTLLWMVHDVGTSQDLWDKTQPSGWQKTLLKKGVQVGFSGLSYGSVSSFKEGISFLTEELQQAHKNHPTQNIVVVGYGIGGTLLYRVLEEKPSIVQGMVAVAAPHHLGGSTDAFQAWLKRVSSFKTERIEGSDLFTPEEQHVLLGNRMGLNSSLSEVSVSFLRDLATETAQASWPYVSKEVHPSWPLWVVYFGTDAFAPSWQCRPGYLKVQEGFALTRGNGFKEEYGHQEGIFQIFLNSSFFIG